MGEVKHTPGPWFCDHGGRVYHRPDPLTKIVVADMQSSSEADEKLIVAAPDLLEALTSVVYAYAANSAEPDKAFKAITAHIGKASAAISKAESSHGA